MHVESQVSASSKFDEAERIRQRMDGLRKHHNESTDIYNRTQPILDEQMHDETMKYLQNNEASGAKTKNRKPRATKKQRNPLISSETQQQTMQPNQQSAYEYQISQSSIQTNSISYNTQPMPQRPPQQQQVVYSQYSQTNHNGYAQHQMQRVQHQSLHGHGSMMPNLPNDLDFNLQAGLECDVDSLIKHEMSVEGRLDFNHDLLLKLDNPYQAHPYR